MASLKFHFGVKNVCVYQTYISFDIYCAGWQCSFPATFKFTYGNTYLSQAFTRENFVGTCTRNAGFAQSEMLRTLEMGSDLDKEFSRNYTGPLPIHVYDFCKAFYEYMKTHNAERI